MANRTVSVELQAKVAGYVSGIKEASTATEGLNDELDDIGKHEREFAEAEKSAVTLSAAMEETAKATDKTGTQMKESAVDARFLADELKKARTAALEAAAAFALTGDKAKLLEFRKQTNYANQLSRVDKALTADAAKAGEQVGQAMASGLDTAIKGPKGLWQVVGSVLTNPVGLAATLAAVALVGGEIGGAAGGAIIAGLGVAGVGAGVAASLNDPAVQRAVSGLKGGFAELAAGIGQDFAGPTTDAIHILRAELDHLRPSIRETLAELAPETTVLAQGAASGLDVFWEHLSKALVNSKPLIEWTARELPKLADDIGGLIETMSEHTDEAEFALDALFGIIKVGIKTLEVFTTVGAGAIGAVEGLQEAASKVPVVGDAFSRAYGQLDVLDKTVTDQTIPNFAALSQQLQATALDADDLAGAMSDKVVNALLAADHATLSLAEAQTRLSDTLKENGKAFDIHSAKGQANREAILSVVQANLAQYDSMIKSGYSAQEAAAAYDQNTAALERQLKKAGFTAQQIQELIGKYKGVPDKVDTEIAAHGLEAAIDRLGYLLAKLNGLDGSTFGFFIHGYTEVDPISSHHDYAQGGQLPHAAQGAFYPAHGAGIVIAENQTHGEWMIPQAGISQARAATLLAGAARPWGMTVGGGGGGNLTITLQGGDPLTRTIVGSLRGYVQGTYGGNVQLALGQ